MSKIIKKTLAGLALSGVCGLFMANLPMYFAKLEGFKTTEKYSGIENAIKNAKDLISHTDKHNCFEKAYLFGPRMAAQEYLDSKKE